jgi:PTS system nitrogen regulatory IIA component
VNRLASVLDVEDVKVDVVAENKLSLFVQAAGVFERHRWTGALSTVADTLIERERLASTGLGHGVAIPHGRLKGLKRSVAAVIRVKEALRFGGPDEERVMLFVFLFVPELATQSDLEILAEIAEMLSDKTLRERLKHEGDANSIYATIAGWTPRGTTDHLRPG